MSKTRITLAAAFVAVALFAFAPTSADASPPAEKDSASHGGASGHGATAKHGGAHPRPKHPPINWFSLNYGKGKTHANPPIGWAFVNFFILLYLLYRFAGKPFTNFLKRRHDEAKKALEEAEELRRQAKERLAEIEAKLDGLDDEIAQIRRDVAADAEREREAIIKKAEDEAERMIENADRTIEEEVSRVKQRLEGEVVNRAIEAAHELLRLKVTEADRTRLDEEFLSEFETFASADSTATPPS